MVHRTIIRNTQTTGVEKSTMSHVKSQTHRQNRKSTPRFEPQACTVHPDITTSSGHIDDHLETSDGIDLPGAQLSRGLQRPELLAKLNCGSVSLWRRGRGRDETSTRRTYVPRRTYLPSKGAVDDFLMSDSSHILNHKVLPGVEKFENGKNLHGVDVAWRSVRGP